MRVRLGVFDHAGNINHHHRIVAHDSRVVTRWQQRHLARTELLLAAVVHQNGEPSGDVILQVRRFATFGFHQRLERRGPFPTRLECGAAKRDATERDEFEFAFVERAKFVRFRQVFALHFGHNVLSFDSLATMTKRKPAKLICKHFPEAEI
jgi:hypothetical protein